MRLVSVPLVLACLAIAAFGVINYPLNQIALGLALSVYAVILWMRPESWLFFIPAILPVADLAPWSGCLYFEELDLFVLVTIAVGYWKLINERPACCLPKPAIIFLAMLSASYAISAYVGVMPLQRLDANAFSNYFSHYNSLRILKPFLLALLLLPLLQRSMGVEEMKRLFVPGMMTGLLLVSIVSIWERAAFPGIMNFASDYRTTASFPEMHTGGAALDSYLALSLPFAIFGVFRGRGKSGMALVLLALASYAVMTTFSRGLYLGYASSIIVMGFFMASSKRASTKSWPLLLLLFLCALMLVKTFGTGGYRGLLAGSLLLGSSFFVGGQRSFGVKGVVAVSSSIVTTSLLLYVFFGKGAYVAYALSAAIFAAGLFMHAMKHERTGMVLAVSGFFSMIPNDLLVNLHWGGRPALLDAIALSAFALLLAFGNRRMRLWAWERETGLTVSAGFMLMMLVIPVVGNYYMKGRFEDADSDLHVRLSHWAGVLGVMDGDPMTYAFGMGLGRFPEVYFWRNREYGQPSTYLFGMEDGVRYLRLGGSREAYSGNVLRYGQRLPIKPFRNYVAGFDMRSAYPKEEVEIGMCEKLLLYSMNCTESKIFPAPDGEWHHYTVTLNSGAIGSEPWYRLPTSQFYFGNESGNGYLDLKNVSLSDGTEDLIHNGNFAKGSERWFFSSDYFHLPWHEKNLFLHIYFDQGLLGLASFVLLALYTLLTLIKRAIHGDLLAATLLASLLSLFAVGLFDSVLDFPRIALLIYLLLFISVLKPAAMPGGRA